MHILITGGLGFIGSHLIEHLLSEYPDVHILNLDALTYAACPETQTHLHTKYPERYTWIHGRVGDTKLLHRLLPQVDYVVHCAAESNVDLSLHDSHVFLESNILETQVLLEACRQHTHLRRFLLVSTDEVYGNPWLDKPSLESDPLLPCSPYAASKAGQDLLAYSYWVSFGVPVVRTRCVNNYGPRQDPTKLIPRFTLHTLQQQALPLYGSGKNLREWIHAQDHARALLYLLFHPEALEGEVFNVGTGLESSALEIGHSILAHFQSPLSQLQGVEDRAGHVQRHAVNSTKLRELGWKPQIDWQTGFTETLNWYASNPRWVKAMIAHQTAHIPEYTSRYGLKAPEGNKLC